MAYEIDALMDCVVTELLQRNEYLDALLEKAEYEAVVMKKLDSWICDRGASA